MAVEPIMQAPPSRAAAAAGTVLLRVLNAALGFVASVAVSRAILPHGRGVYTLAVTVAGMAVVAAAWGVPRALAFAWMRRLAPARLAGAALVLAAVLGVPAALMAGAVAGAVPALAPAGSVLPWAAVAAVPALVATAHLTALLNLADRPRAAAAFALLGGGVQTALLLLLAALGRLTPLAVTLVWSVAGLVVLGPLTGYARALLGVVRPPARLLTGLLRRGAAYQPGQVAGHLLQRVDMLLLAALSGTASVGIYGLAVALGESVLLVTGAVAVAGIGAQARDPGGHDYTARLARTAVGAGLVLLAVLTFAAPWLVPAVFGRAFGPTVPALLALAPGILALAAREPLEMFVTRQDRPGPASAIAVVALGGNVALNLVLIPRFGALGAAVASSVAYCAHLAVVAVWFLRVSRLPWTALVPRPADVIAPLRALGAHLRHRRAG